MVLFNTIDFFRIAVTVQNVELHNSRIPVDIVATVHLKKVAIFQILLVVSCFRRQLHLPQLQNQHLSDYTKDNKLSSLISCQHLVVRSLRSIIMREVTR